MSDIALNNRKLIGLYFKLMLRAYSAQDYKTALVANKVLAKQIEWGK
jgi:hypothetical protein